MPPSWEQVVPVAPSPFPPPRTDRWALSGRTAPASTSPGQRPAWEGGLGSGPPTPVPQGPQLPGTLPSPRGTLLCPCWGWGERRKGRVSPSQGTHPSVPVGRAGGLTMPMVMLPLGHCPPTFAGGQCAQARPAAAAVRRGPQTMGRGGWGTRVGMGQRCPLPAAAPRPAQSPAAPGRVSSWSRELPCCCLPRSRWWLSPPQLRPRGGRSSTSSS